MKIIVAADENWGIGKQNRLLVSIPADMKFFRSETTGKVVVMGRRTLESFPGGRPLKNRVNIVLTSRKDYKAEGALIVHDLEELSETLKAYDPDSIYCIGGGMLYRELLPLCDTCYVTRIHFVYEADTFFPDLDASEEWTLFSESEEMTYFDLEYQFLVYKKRQEEKPYKIV